MLSHMANHNPIILKLVCGPTGLKTDPPTKEEYQLLIELVDAAKAVDDHPNSATKLTALHKALVALYGSEEGLRG